MQRSTILLAVMAAALPLAACGSKTETADNSAAAVTTNGTEMTADTLGAKIRALPRASVAVSCSARSAMPDPAVPAASRSPR